MSKHVVRVWVEEFGGGQWVEYPVPSPIDPDAAVRDARRSVLYGPGYQGHTGSRQGRGIWNSYRGPGT